MLGVCDCLKIQQEILQEVVIFQKSGLICYLLLSSEGGGGNFP